MFAQAIRARAIGPAVVAAGVWLAGLAAGNRVSFTDNVEQRQQCSGMYGHKDWAGSIDPYISVAVEPVADSGNTIGLVIFEWADVDLIGVEVAAGQPKKYFCDETMVQKDVCTHEHLGEFLLEGSTNGSIASVFTTTVRLADPQPKKYQVSSTGFYCVGTYSLTGAEYAGEITFQNPYGELPASQIAKLPFYGGLAIAYIVLLSFWMFLYVQYRSDILPVQNYITACAAFLAVEMIIVWGYYDLLNMRGHTLFSRFYMVFVALLNAFRNAFSFFLLLIVCMGYGVVKPTLGSTMIKVRVLAGLHLVFGVVYAIASFLVTPDTAGPIALLAILPLASTMTAFYLWILSTLTGTIRDLTERKQTVKALMYRRLWYLLLISIIVIFGFFFVNSLIFADRNSPDFVPRHWKSRWFILDGWLNAVYLVDFAIIAFLWRPTKDNRRFSMSDEIAQDDDADGFEIGSLAGSLDDEENNISNYSSRVASPAAHYAQPAPKSAAAAGAAGAMASFSANIDDDDTPPGADLDDHKALADLASDDDRNSLEAPGEPMFVAHEDDYDRWSEDDDYNSGGYGDNEEQEYLKPKSKAPGKDD
ncbi:lung seven transmembrane receptor-domain-containing protein [Dipodascopsis tothii]|uniref:lung seven transmembrane receptor-domain-containing protein n=1 Tax=Dipodascopsis tothii TaxID=44089 RepID=UPI0034CD7C30